MKFTVHLVPSADQDLDGYRAREQRIILDAIAKLLVTDADKESKKRKRLRANPLAPWELRIGPFRVFYEIRPGRQVRVLAVGHKQHGDLIVRGQRFEL